MNFIERAFFVLSILAFTNLQTLAASGDCAPLGLMPDYERQDDSKPRRHDIMEFKTAKGDDYELSDVTGRACRQVYTIKEGAQMASDLDIQKNYLAQLAPYKGEQTFADDRNLYARFNKDGHDGWLHVYSQENEIQVTVIEKEDFKPVLSKPASFDYTLFGHMPGYTGTLQKRNFDKFTYPVQDGDYPRDVIAEGARWSIVYVPVEGAQYASDYDVKQNFADAVKKLGGQVLYDHDHLMSARFEKDGKSVWVHIYTQENETQLNVIEEKDFAARAAPPEASALKAALDKDGHVALYVNFDFDKAVLKPDAAPIIAQVVKLLKDNPELKLSIDGHTDNIGTSAYNTRLSSDRAASVVAALTAQGIAAERLKSQGFGFDKPVANNDTGEGRAKNRRVELVKLNVGKTG
jgi:outer membrane protein OmpA-like peptidoglycan-associated protein